MITMHLRFMTSTACCSQILGTGSSTGPNQRQSQSGQLASRRLSAMRASMEYSLTVTAPSLDRDTLTRLKSYEGSTSLRVDSGLTGFGIEPDQLSQRHCRVRL